MAKLIDLIVSGKSSFASDINAKIIYSTRLYMSGAISTCNTPGSWVSGMTNAAIRYNDNAAITTRSYHPFLSMKAAGGHVVNFGGLNNTIGFYGFYNGRTANAYDWWFTVNSATGKWSMSESITSSAFITSGGANTQVVRGDGTLQTISSLSVSHASTADNADTLDNYHEGSFYRYRGSYGKSYTAASTEYNLGPGTYKTLEQGYSGTLLSFNNSTSSASCLQFWTHYHQGYLHYRTSIDSNRWGKTNGEWTRILDSDNYTTFVNTTNFPGLNKVGTVTSVTVTGTNGLSGSGTVTSSGTITLSNSGVRSVSINGNYLRVNTNGTNTDLTIPYATSAGSVAWGNVTGKPDSFAPASHNHDTVYVKKAGDTMTGLLTTTSAHPHKGIKVGDTYINAIGGNLIFQNNSSIRFGGDSWDYSVWAGLKYVHSSTSKIIYLGLADGTAFTANSPQSGGKLYLPGIDNVYTGNGTYLVWHAGNDGSGSGLDADMTDGLHVHSGRNNEANKIVRTDGSGYIQAGWINTTSGDMGTTAATRIYCSNDAYIRYKTLANLSSDIAGQLYWANVKVSTTSNSGTSPTFSTATAGKFVANNGSGPHFTGTSTSGNWAYLSLNNSSSQWNIGTNNSSSTGSGGLWLSRYNGENNGIFVSAADTPKVGINTSSPSYALHVISDAYATGWVRAGIGFYVEGKGVHYMSNNASGYGQIYLTGNEFNWSSSSTKLFFNYRQGANGTTVTSYIWNAGSSTTYASHTTGQIDAKSHVLTTNNFGINSTSGGGRGISLYGGSGYVDKYGIAFNQTSNWGTHGYVTGEWATYFTMQSYGNTRGWIFRANSNNIFSIDDYGNAYANGLVNADRFNSRVDTGTQPYACTSTTLNTNLNADMTDGLHVHGGRNNESNKIVRTDSSGYIQAGYINTGVSTEDSLSCSRLFFEYGNDGYIRKLTPARFRALITDSVYLPRLRMRNPSNGTSEQGGIPFPISLKNAGYPLYTDAEFASSSNRVNVYNNAGNDTVTITRMSDNQGSANSSGYILQISTTSGTASPGRGGFMQIISSRKNAVFAQIFRAKIPTGFSVKNAENSMGTGYSTHWLTDTAGTGKWEWYIRITICGASGTFSSGGRVYLEGSGAVTWYLSYCNVIDLTKGNYDGLRTRYSDYATSAGNADTVDNKHASYFTYNIYAGNVDCNTIDTHSAVYRLGGSPTNAFPNANHGNMLVIGAAYDTMTQIGAPYNADELYFRRGNWTSEGGTIRTNAWKAILHSGNYTSYVNTTNFPGLNKTGTVTSVTVTGSNGLSGSGTVTTSGTITLSNSGVRSTTINGNYLRVNTNGTNTDLTIPYATNADTVDGYHASHFATSGHTHSYLPLSGGTLTGGFGKSSNYIFKPNGADYRTTANTETGAICISLPASIGNTMFSMWIDVYNYSTNTSFSVHVGGYTYNSTFKYNPFAMVYGSSHKVRLTYSEGYKIYIGETTSTWTYPQISIRDILIGYNPTYTSWLSGWSISFVTTLPAINSEISRYVLSSDNYSTLVSPKTHDHTFESITSKPTTLSGYGITDGMYFLNDSANYLGARFLNATHAKKAAEKFIEFWQNNAGWFNFKAGKYIVSGATSSQFLKGDGSLDSNSYLTSINKSMVERVLTGKIKTHSHYSLITEADNRNTNTTPNDYNNSIIFRGLKGNATIGCTSDSDYSYLIGLRGWSDSSGGNSHELAFNNDGIFRRQGATTNWGSWYKLLDSGNYNSYTPSLTGAGASGTWGISISGNAATATDADKLDGVHASGLFTALSNSGNNISITVGGTTKTLTVGYASNADTVDGYHHSDFVHTRSAIAGTDLNVYDINNSFIHDYIWTNAPTSNIIGSVIDLTYSPDWRYQIFCVPNSNNLIYTRARYSGTTWTNWKTIAFTDSDITGNAATATDADKLDGVHASGLFTALSNSGNNISVTVGGTNKTLTIGYATSAGSATSATKLQTARTIWGQSFNGTANISGSLSGVTNINASGNIYAAAYYENSDVRLKKDVSSIVSSVNIPVIKEFKWKQTNHKSYGLIAQDLEAMGYPELVYIKDDGYKSVNYTAALCLIIGKQQLKIKELEDRIKYIESK